MKFTCISSGSVGNCYLMDSGTQVLILELGVNFKDIKVALDFNLSKVCGALVTHEHLDHCKAVTDAAKAGIDIYSSPGTINAINISSHRLHPVFAMKDFMIGEFKIKPFDVRHDCAEPFGYLIYHPQCGNTLFITDSFYCKYTFPNLNNIIVEANYCEDIMAEKFFSGDLNKIIRDRVMKSHMSLKTCKELLQANDLKAVNNIVLIHLSDGNSDERKFKKQVQELTGKNVHTASKNLVINLDKSPF